jgi:hypothetical protein
MDSLTLNGATVLQESLLLASWSGTIAHSSLIAHVALHVESTMEKSIALSTAEAEHYSASEMAIKRTYLRYLPANMARGTHSSGRTTLRCLTRRTRLPALKGRITSMFFALQRAKHIDIRKHFAHEAVQNGHIWLYQISTKHQLADLLTKPLQLGPFERCLYSLLGEDPPRRDDRNFLED